MANLWPRRADRTAPRTWSHLSRLRLRQMLKTAVNGTVHGACSGVAGLAVTAAWCGSATGDHSPQSTG
jgi:hypothetical protein